MSDQAVLKWMTKVKDDEIGLVASSVYIVGINNLGIPKAMTRLVFAVNDVVHD